MIAILFCPIKLYRREIKLVAIFDCFSSILKELQLPYFKLAATEVISGVSGESEEKLRELFAAAQVGIEKFKCLQGFGK